MDVAERVVDRLRRIRELDRRRAPATAILGELRELVREASAWARLEGDGRAAAAAAELAETLRRAEAPEGVTADASGVRRS